jgi:hypothetical protein
MKPFKRCVDRTPAQSSDWPRATLWALVILLAAPACHRWFATTPTWAECRWPDWPRGTRAPEAANLSAVKPYRNYLAVSQVDAISEHFTIWHAEQMQQVRVVRDSSGHPIFESEGGMEGGVGSGPENAPALPSAVAVLAHDLEAELRDHCPWVPSWNIQYKGRYRKVTVQEFIALVAWPAGWFATYQVAMDESLQRIAGTLDSMSGLSLGAMEIPRDAQWLAIPPGNGMKLTLVSSGPQPFTSEIADAARRLVQRAKGPTPASLVPADAPLLPPGFVSRVVVKVDLLGVTQTPPSVTARLEAPIELHDAVFGSGASGDSEAMLGGELYRMHATLIPDTPSIPTPGRSDGKFSGTLTVHIGDQHGHAWEHAYPAHGALDLEGDSVVAPWGIGIPGASSPSREAEELRGQLPGIGPYRAVELRVDHSSLVDPRR